jgi:transcriptional regulator with XRE-family HTH domain
VPSMRSPTVRHRRLTSELRRLREIAKLTCEDVAERLECSASKISRIETGRVAVSPRDVRDLLLIYGVTGGQHDGLMQLARESRQKGWWHAYGDSVQPQLATYLGLESAASEMRVYRVNRLPGLLQTDDYTRALLAERKVRTPPPDHEKRFALLAERRRLAEANPPTVWVVLDEAVLRRQVGGLEVTRAQIEHLIELSATPHMFLQVIPFSGGAHVGMDEPFVILAFPDQADPDVVCVGYSTGMLWVEDVSDVRYYNTIFDHLQSAALSFDESVALMTSVLKAS